MEEEAEGPSRVDAPVSLAGHYGRPKVERRVEAEASEDVSPTLFPFKRFGSYVQDPFGVSSTLWLFLIGEHPVCFSRSTASPPACTRARPSPRPVDRRLSSRPPGRRREPGGGARLRGTWTRPHSCRGARPGRGRSIEPTAGATRGRRTSAALAALVSVGAGCRSTKDGGVMPLSSGPLPSLPSPPPSPRLCASGGGRFCAPLPRCRATSGAPWTGQTCFAASNRFFPPSAGALFIYFCQPRCIAGQLSPAV